MRTFECYHSGLKPMDPHATWCMAWSLIYLLPSCPAPLLSADSRALLSRHTCSWAKLLHVLPHASPGMLQSYLPTAWICTSVQVLSCCPSVQCRWMQNWFCCLTVAEFIFTGNCVHEAWCFLVCRGRQALSPLRAASASQPAVTEMEGHFKVWTFISLGWSTCAKMSW